MRNGVVESSAECVFETAAAARGEPTIHRCTPEEALKGWRQPVIAVLTGSSCLRFLPGRPTLRLLRGLAGVPSSGLSWSAPSSLCPVTERSKQNLTHDTDMNTAARAPRFAHISFENKELKMASLKRFPLQVFIYNELSLLPPSLSPSLGD